MKLFMYNRMDYLCVLLLLRKYGHEIICKKVGLNKYGRICKIIQNIKSLSEIIKYLIGEIEGKSRDERQR